MSRGASSALAPARAVDGTISGRDHDTLLHVRDDIRAALVVAQDERHLRQDVVERTVTQTTGAAVAETEIGWVVHERLVVLAKVTEHRVRFGLAPVAEQAVALVEHQASGHADYTRKFALYAAELACGLRSPERPWA